MPGEDAPELDARITGNSDDAGLQPRCHLAEIFNKPAQKIKPQPAVLRQSRDDREQLLETLRITEGRVDAELAQNGVVELDVGAAGAVVHAAGEPAASAGDEVAHVFAAVRRRI